MSIADNPAHASPPPSLLGQLEEIASWLKNLAAADWAKESATGAKAAVLLLEQVARHTSAVKVGVLARVESSGAWEGEGQRTMGSWVTTRTRSSRKAAFQAVELAKTLHEDLPETKKALAEGVIGEEHAQVIARECTKSDSLKKRLADPQRGEAFLVEKAQEVDATGFAKLAKGWAVETDPKGADRAWRKDAAKEDLTVTPLGEGYRVNGWLNPVNGALVKEALDAHAGRKSADDERTFPQRQAAALVSLARQSLDAGLQKSSARIRPHLSITMDYRTLEQLVAATEPTLPPAFGGEPHSDPGEWISTWRPGDDHTISSAVDHTKLVDVPPATLADGTPLPPEMLARLVCESMLTRIVFGPESTVLDVGRTQRIFPANQARAIIARDRHCKYPGCDEGPERSEIHHSLEWFKHNGTTHVDLGVLLCWFHHDLVHQRGIQIARHEGSWIFTTRSGQIIVPPGTDPPLADYLDPITNMDTTIGVGQIAPHEDSLPSRSPAVKARPRTESPRSSARPPRNALARPQRRARAPNEDATLFDTEPPF